MIYINETDGMRTAFKPLAHPYREFSEDDFVAASRYQDMIKKRIQQSNELDRQIEKTSFNTSEPVYYSTNNSRRDDYRNAKMHWLYFILIGWWLGLTLACFIFPIFIKGFVKKAFGYW